MSELELRDYFAAAALEGMVSGRWKKENRTPEPSEFAEHAYKMADAMMEARQK